MAQPQPAKVSYFFGKGYSDLWNTIKESWSRNIHSAGDQFSLACEKGCFTMGGGMNLIAAISIFTFGSLITAFTTFAHIAVLFAFFAFIYMGFDLNAYGASSKDFDDILNIMLINLEKMFGLKDKDTLKRNLAVVINKVDIPTLEEKIGETAAQQYLAENAKTCKSYMDARDAVCRNFLEEYGAGNFVRTAEAKFKTVRYFTCSALGHNHEGQPYEGKNVVDPVMWLLQQADSSIKAE